MSNTVTRIGFFGLLALVLTQVGCASLNRHSGYQPVAVRSEPPGASVEVDGKVVGQTPTYVLIERDRYPKAIKVGGAEVPLTTRYRWGASFGNGFAIAMFAPISWGIDFLTGAAWEIKDPAPVKLGSKFKKQSSTQVIAIAPPVSESLTLSEVAANEFELVLRTDQRDGVLIKPYSETLPIFLGERFDYDGGGNSDDRKVAYFKTGADAIYFSRIEHRNEEYLLKAELKDSFTDKVIDTKEVVLSTDNSLAKAYGASRRLVTFFPNTIGLSLQS
ncbi:MAG: PEGA domain-containing protein, partial [Bdellovibrionota bacterium]